MSNYYVSYSDEAKDDLRNIFMHIAYNLGSRDNAEGQVNRIREAKTNERVEIVRIPYGAMDLDKFFENMT